MVGRATELGRILESLGRVEAGQPRVQVISGEAGVGKSRLLAEFVEAARAAGSLVVGGACIPLVAAGLPYHPLLQALRRLATELDPELVEWLNEPAQGELRQLFPGAQPGAPRPDENSVSRLFEAFAELVERVSSDRLLVLTIEDVHWSDRSTLDLLSFLARVSTGGRLLLVVTVRTEGAPLRGEVIECLTELRRARYTDHLELRRLSRDQTAELIAAIRGSDVPAALVDEIYARSEGNPFFVEELLAGAPEMGLSPSLRDLALAQVAALSERAQQLLRAAAAAGRSVEHDLLVRVAGLDEARPDVLREILRHHVLTLEQETDRYRFRHALVREAVYDEVLPGERQRLHLAYARALSETVDGQALDPAAAAEVAYHWDRAGARESAYVAYLRAARAAKSSYAHHEALGHYQRALELADTEGLQSAEPVAPSLLREIADTAYLAGEPALATGFMRRALDAMGPDSDPLALGQVLGHLARCQSDEGRSVEGLETMEAAVRMVADQPPSQGKAQVLADYGRLLFESMRLEDAVPLNRVALELARTVGASTIEAEALITLGASVAEVEDYEEGLSLLRESLRIARDLGDVRLMIRATKNLTVYLDMGGRNEEAVALERAAVEQARQMGVGHSLGCSVMVNLVHSLIDLGRFDEAEEVARDAMDHALDSLIGTYLTTALIHLAAERRDADLAARVLAQHPELARLGDSMGGGASEGIALEAAIAQARWAVVRETAAQLSHLPNIFQQWPQLATAGIHAEAELATMARHRRDEAAAEECKRRAAALYDALLGLPLPATLPRARIDAMRACAAAQMSRVKGLSEPEVWSRAVHALEVAGSPQSLADARYRWAEAILGAGGDRSEAVSILRDAYRSARDLRIMPLVKEIEGLARRARIEIEEGMPGQGAPPDAGLGLTRRELEVLRLIAVGATNREIARRLFVGEKTVATHVSNILGKLEAANRVEAVAIASRAIGNLGDASLLREAEAERDSPPGEARNRH